MTHVAHTHPVAHGLSVFVARSGAGLHRFGARLIEARMRQAEAIVAERRNWIEGTHTKVARHDADGFFL